MKAQCSIPSQQYKPMQKLSLKTEKNTSRPNKNLFKTCTIYCIHDIKFYINQTLNVNKKIILSNIKDDTHHKRIYKPKIS